jgi:hypothetical protein
MVTCVSEMAPPIYVRLEGTPRMPILHRLIALAIAAAGLGVLLVAAWLQPSAEGVGTHTQLGMQPCQFLYRTGLPCAGCGMTTSFTWFAHGSPITSFITQPFGFVLAVCCGIAFWAGLYCAVTGKASYRLLRMIPMSAHLWFWLGLGLFGWVWKTVTIVAAR